MNGPFVVVMAVFMAIPLLLGAIIAVFVVVASTKAAPLPPDSESDVNFYARVLRSDELFSTAANVSSRTNGRLTVTASHVLWHPEAGDPWAAPIPALTVGSTHGAFSISGQGVDVAIDHSGSWRFSVSDRPINKFARNTAKDFREADAARKLAHLLLARGARQA